MAKMEEDSEFGNIPEILSTHPASEKRALELEDLIPEVEIKSQNLESIRISFFIFFKALKLRKDCKCQELPKDLIFAKKISSQEESTKPKSLNLKKI
jgi:hypothetical protein